MSEEPMTPRELDCRSLSGRGRVPELLGVFLVFCRFPWVLAGFPMLPVTLYGLRFCGRLSVDRNLFVSVKLPQFENFGAWSKYLETGPNSIGIGLCRFVGIFPGILGGWLRPVWVPKWVPNRRFAFGSLKLTRALLRSCPLASI